MKPYSEYAEFGQRLGWIECEEPSTSDIVEIYYGDVPSHLIGREKDVSALTSEADKWLVYEPEEAVEIGTINIAGQLAGYTKHLCFRPDKYEYAAVFIKGSTFVCVCGFWHSFHDEDAMSIIDNISLP